MNKGIKQEASIPVQSRISVNTLAELDIYWESEGHYVKSMSQLVSFSVELLREILFANSKLPKQIVSVGEAKQHLERKRLFQPSLKTRAFKKIGTAISFENLRDEGVDPKDHVPQQYNMLHNKRSIDTYEGGGQVLKSDVEFARRTLKSLRMSLGKDCNVKEGMTDDDAEEFARRDREKLAAQNAAMDELMNKR